MRHSDLLTQVRACTITTFKSLLSCASLRNLITQTALSKQISIYVDHYQLIADITCPDGDGIISPMEAPPFFRPSGLPEHVLSNIWRLSAPQNALRSPVSSRFCTSEHCPACVQHILQREAVHAHCKMSAAHAQGQLRIALRMAYDALQGKPLPDAVQQPPSPIAAARAGSGAAGLPPAQQLQAAGGGQRTGSLSREDMDVQISRFQVRRLDAAAKTRLCMMPSATRAQIIESRVLWCSR